MRPFLHQFSNVGSKSFGEIPFASWLKGKIMNKRYFPVFSRITFILKKVYVIFNNNNLENYVVYPALTHTCWSRSPLYLLRFISKINWRPIWITSQIKIIKYTFCAEFTWIVATSFYTHLLSHGLSSPFIWVFSYEPDLPTWVVKEEPAVVTAATPQLVKQLSAFLGARVTGPTWVSETHNSILNWHYQ